MNAHAATADDSRVQPVEAADKEQSIPTEVTVAELDTVISKESGDFITLFDCANCGSLFTSEQDLEHHQCDNANVNVDAPTNIGKKKNGQPGKTGKSQNQNKKPASKKPSKAASKATTHISAISLNEASNKDNDSHDLTYQLTDPLSDLPASTQIEIITSNTDFNSFPSIVIDGMNHIPVNLLATNEQDDTTSQDSVELSKGNKLLSSVNVTGIAEREKFN